MKNRRRIWEHVLFWVLYWLLLAFYGGLYDKDFEVTLLYNLTIVPVTIACTYILVYALLPLYFRRQHIAFLGLSLLVVVAGVLLKRLSTQYVQFPWLYSGSDYTFTFFSAYRITGHFIEIIITAGLVAGMHYFRDWQRTTKRMEALNAEKRAAELSFLKAQMHPHFLFNTLNSIYYESVRPSGNAPDLIIRLAEIMRYTLRQGSEEWIPLRKEVELIRNYMALEQVRYGERLLVNLEVLGELDGGVPPLICFSLVENAFKHGTAQQMGRCEIHIWLKVDDGRMHLEIRNPLPPTEASDVMGASEGIGLRNITRQLDLIFGEGYRLECRPEGNEFLSKLEIPIQVSMV